VTARPRADLLDRDRATRGTGRARSFGDVRSLVFLMGDQLHERSPAMREFDPARDAVVMMEVLDESRHVPSHRQRTVLFLSAMRHHAAELRRRGVRVWYSSIDDPENAQSFGAELRRVVDRLRPREVRLVQPGDHRVDAMVQSWRRDLQPPITVVEDDHFLTTDEQFRGWADGRKELVMEFFYRERRRRLGILVNADGSPVGGAWNFDKENRESFKSAPRVPKPLRFPPDAITREVMDLVDRLLPSNPGVTANFDWPVTRADALAALRDFIDNRLPDFGRYEDAMWTGEPFLYHSLLSAPLNLKLLEPRECVAAAVEAYERGRAPLASVEGFIRQIIGWREYIRGVYRLFGPTYADRNWLGHDAPLPPLYWNARTDMACLRECVGQVIDRGFGHHIQRLMVTGNFALLAGVHPKAVSDWYLGMYVDAVDWVTLPNTLGMSQHADGTAARAPVVGTKPYISSGQYIDRMSDYCGSCRYDPSKSVGPEACPFSVLYWDFLIRHRERFAGNHRMTMMLKNVDRMPRERVVQLTTDASLIRRGLSGGEPVRGLREPDAAPPKRPSRRRSAR
jgi:deoxyribodipyrimidine photolyase-related protein